MTDIPSWRRQTQLARTRSTEPQACALPPDHNYSLSTSPTDSTKSRPRRSLASFASYLNTHRAAPLTSQLEWPAIDWSTLNERDDVYRPDPDHMCNTLRQHLLANPSDDLPAQYNSFVLHVIEAYQRVKSETNDLGRRLQMEQHRHQNCVNEFRQAATGSTHDAIKPTRVADSRSSISIDHGDDQNLGRKPISNVKLLAMLPKTDTGYLRKRPSHDHSQPIEAPSHHESHRPSSGLSWHSGVLAASKPNSGSRPHSAASFDTTPGHITRSSTESESSSGNEDHIALTSIALAANAYSNKGRLLSQQYEYHTNHHLHDSSSKTSAFRSSSHGLWPEEMSETVAKTPSDLAPTIPTKTAAMESGGQIHLIKKAHIQSSPLTAEEARKRRQHRGFSFMPGDDFVLPMHSTSPDVQSKGTHRATSTPITAVRDEPNDGKASDDSLRSLWQAKAAPDSNSYTQLTEPVVSLAERERNSSVFKREGSSKSVLTAIKESSSRSSSLSHKGSVGSIGSRGGSSAIHTNPRENSFAIAAAARAATKRQTQS